MSGRGLYGTVLIRALIPLALLALAVAWIYDRITPLPREKD